MKPFETVLKLSYGAKTIEVFHNFAFWPLRLKALNNAFRISEEERNSVSKTQNASQLGTHFIENMQLWGYHASGGKMGVTDHPGANE